MFNLVALSALRKICLYLPDPRAAKLLESIFGAEGLAASSVATLAEFQQAMQSQHFTAIVTVSSCVDEIRKVSDLPIVDIQPLIENWRQAGSFQKLSAFEILTFLQGTCFVATRR
ncbi:hypothetical protein G6L26_027425 (plasmid) [Agrobacterium radiobacter]|uniref:Uncharacterized protein n=1 Tax=Agrobacterium tumefaciens str. B6 TaxID=1183423 RepID=A0A822V6V1_AGRTU|nr:hypothetical protein [Agrobacterium tumefaciens]MQB27853.1 hypothetical protein [Agrobacterium tumefaciens]NTA08373.1 hypothetical protein [Agrobacterium tumefaciens]NTB16195.1 hypothetical protein [Agrobacterium tumefaciens]CVI25230.1 hypothetical protein AGR4A_pAt30045 [Agrobacterium tumefaciens str. B6]SPZ33144.1 Uncharacterised protein [Agrobacterium tumefaciens]